MINTEEEYKNKVTEFITKLRADNCIDEGLYDSISDYLVLQRKKWEKQNHIPLTVFETCIDLLNSIAGGNRFLSEENQERLEDIGDEIYGAFMGFE